MRCLTCLHDEQAVSRVSQVFSKFFIQLLCNHFGCIASRTSNYGNRAQGGKHAKQTINDVVHDGLHVGVLHIPSVDCYENNRFKKIKDSSNLRTYNNKTLIHYSGASK